MKKFLLSFAFVFTLLGIAATSAPRAAAADVNAFTIQEYTVDYYLGRDTEGRSTLKTVEVIRAIFPQTNQNHGLERALPTVYDGHATGLRVTAVTDQRNKALQYSSRTSGNNQVLRIGNPDTYVHGDQTYRITYTQRDVTRFFKDTGADEFYWDTNGTEWAVPIQSLRATVHLDDKLRGKLTSKQACYIGVAGATSSCEVTKNADGFTVAATNLQPRENITIAAGFTAGTFTAYQPSLGQRLLALWQLSLAVTSAIALGLVIWFIVRYTRQSDRTDELGAIPPEYLPPPDTSVSTAGTIAKKSGTLFSAQLIDLAVRHYLKIYQTREKSLFRQANYELEIIKDIQSLKSEEREVLQDIFGNPVVGARLNMESLKRNTAVARKLTDNPGKLAKDIAGAYGLRAPVPVASAWFKRAALACSIAAVLTLSPGLAVAAIVAIIAAYSLKPLTDKGLALSRYLKGLELYISMAETDRLRMLQSPEGAAKLPAPIDTNDKRQVVKLYERLLPYAIVIGKEKDWNKQLGQYYESLQESPTWMTTHSGVYNAAVFSAAVSGMHTAASYADPTSASSGGSSGGGSSGGGGGGGGGGGW